MTASDFGLGAVVLYSYLLQVLTSSLKTLMILQIIRIFMNIYMCIRARKGDGKSLPRGEGFRVGVT